MKAYGNIVILCVIITLQSCKTYYVKNISSRSKSLQLSYNKCINSTERQNELIHYKEKGIIFNIKTTKNDSACFFQFELQPNRVLPLNTILNIYDQIKNPQEKRVLCTELEDKSSTLCDTIIYKVGEKINLNKFRKVNKLFSFVGKSTFIYQIED